MSIDKSQIVPLTGNARVFVFGYIDDYSTANRIKDDLKADGWQGGKSYDGLAELGDKAKYAVWLDVSNVNLSTWTHPMVDRVHKSGMVMVIYDPATKLWRVVGDEGNKDTWFNVPYNPSTARRRINTVAKNAVNQQAVSTGRKVGIYVGMDADAVVAKMVRGRGRMVPNRGTGNAKSIKAGGWDIMSDDKGEYAYVNRLATQSELTEIDGGNIAQIYSRLSLYPKSKNDIYFMVVVDFDKMVYLKTEGTTTMKDQIVSKAGTTVKNQTVDFMYGSLGNIDTLFQKLGLPTVEYGTDGVTYEDCVINGHTVSGFAPPAFKSCHFVRCLMNMEDSLNLGGDSLIVDCTQDQSKSNPMRVVILEGKTTIDNFQVAEVRVRDGSATVRNSKIGALHLPTPTLVNCNVEDCVLPANVNLWGSSLKNCRATSSFTTLWGGGVSSGTASIVDMQYTFSGSVLQLENFDMVKVLGNGNGTRLEVQSNVVRSLVVENADGYDIWASGNRNFKMYIPIVDRYMIAKEFGNGVPNDGSICRMKINALRNSYNLSFVPNDRTSPIVDVMDDKEFGMIRDLNFPVDEDDYADLDAVTAWESFKVRMASIDNTEYQLPSNPPKDIPTLFKYLAVFNKFRRLFGYID